MLKLTLATKKDKDFIVKSDDYIFLLRLVDEDNKNIKDEWLLRYKDIRKLRKNLLSIIDVMPEEEIF